CKQLEFKNLLSRFEKDAIVTNSQTENFQTLTELAKVEEIFTKAASCFEIGLAILQDGKEDDTCAGIAIALSEKEVYFIPCQGLITKSYLADKLTQLKNKELCKLSVFDSKRLYDMIEPLMPGEDETVAGADVLTVYKERKYFDILLAAYLLNPLKNDYDTETIAGEHLGLMIPDVKQVCGKDDYIRTMEAKPQEFQDFACFQAYVCLMSAQVLRTKLEEEGMLSLLYDIEMPLTRVLYEMEKSGIMVRPDELKAYGEALTGRIAELELAIYEQAGMQFNINSPKQLGEVLFEKMGIPGGKKTKTGYSTAADILEKLAMEYPVVSDILEYRGLAKLKSTYAEGLAAYIDEGNRIHSTFNQTITATGRISSTEPNLQNIPIRMELGRKIRKVFVPADGYLFMDADYSQIELRILAHMSDDKQLIEAYQMEQDIHRITASKVFHT
ncbi:MAG: DNA polymerase I, partial [Lachnospiraceae bacterium]|nr:DNA polymerase I [Lachnospiraceae bacterium]